MVALFDACCGFGGKVPGMRAAVSAEELAGEMARLSIERALVRTAPEELDSDTAATNAALMKACDDLAGLVPCPVVIPDAAGETMGEQQPAWLIGHGAGAVCIRPERDYWALSEWACGGLLAALEDRNVPVFCKEQEVPLEQVADLARRHPRLPIILAGVGYRCLRVVVPMLENFANVHLALGWAFSLNRGIEELTRRLGADRLLFGTGFPETEPAAAVTQLMYADISHDERALIGSGNLERLVGGIGR